MNDLFVRIRFLLPSLPRAEKAIASALLENPEAITHLTLAEIARESGSSEASIIRFCKRMGYDGYSSMKEDFIRALAEAVYERMISERDNIAATYKAEGNSEAKVIRNKTDKEVAIQISDAKKQAEILEAEGEQEYMKILAQAYGEEDRSEFYSFVRSLDALKTSMKGEDKTVILSADSPIAQIFEGK